jgi:DNA-binding MarR family transcriptional regulator
VKGPGWLARAGLAATLVVAFPLTTAAGPVEATFAYNGPGALQGHFDGRCEAAGAVLSKGEPGRVEFESRGGILEIRHTRVNLTILNPTSSPWVIDRADRQWHETLQVPQGGIAVRWGHDGIASFQSPRTNSTSPPLNASLRLSSATFGTVQVGIPAPGGSSYVAMNDGSIATNILSFPGWNRRVTYEGDADVRGDLVLHLRAAHLDHGAGSFTLPPYRTEEQNVSTPAVAQKTVRYTEAFLHLPGARAPLDGSSELICGALQGRVVGSFAVDRAHGTASSGHQAVNFTGRVLTLEGDFAVDERPRDLPRDRSYEGWMDGQAAGAVTVVGLDFGAVPLQDPLGILEQVGFWTTLTALLLLAVAAVAKFAGQLSGSLVGTFYSRVAPHRVLENPQRDRIYQSVLQNPGARLRRIQRMLGLHHSTIQHHLRILHRLGMVEMWRDGSRTTRVRPRGAGQSRAQSLIKADERLAFVHELLAEGPKPLREVVATLRARFAFTRQAAYETVSKAAKAGIVRRSAGIATGVVLERAL